MVTIRKPKQNRAINTFDSIVSAGFISVMKNGLDHTTVLKVCEIAGVGSGSFYEYFKNKEALDLLRKSLLQVHPIYQCSD
ncbi:TetR/AcrR family transcriptional regulator, partial [Acinetobacter baumannii]|uniref:TetR/AcrR family transcriptional regulator n=1 Tax=Acinetobacter baumannii TaxID=470 RepID=UPI0019002BF6